MSSIIDLNSFFLKLNFYHAFYIFRAQLFKWSILYYSEFSVLFSISILLLFCFISSNYLSVDKMLSFSFLFSKLLIFLFFLASFFFLLSFFFFIASLSSNISKISSSFKIVLLILFYLIYLLSFYLLI